MCGKTHLSIGMASAAIGMTVVASDAVLMENLGIEINLGMVAGALFAGICGGLFPDLDYRNSLGNKMLNRAIKWTIIIAAIICVVLIIEEGFSWETFSFDLDLEEWIQIIGVAGILGLALFCRTRPHRAFSHSLTVMILSSFCIYLIFGKLLWLYFGAGFMSHLFIDVFNKKGELLLWPSKKEYALYLCTASGKVNRILLFVGFSVTIICLWLMVRIGILTLFF